MQEQNQEKTLAENIPVQDNVGVLRKDNIKTDVPGLSKSFRGILSDTYIDYRRANKDMLKLAVNKYVRSNIYDATLLRFMLNSVQYENVNMGFGNSSDWVSEYCEDVESVSAVDEQMVIIRRDYRWFNDLMLYLNDKYSERQLLKSEFFRTVNDKALLQNFTKNTEIIEKLTNSIQQEYANTKQNVENAVQDNVKTNNK